MSCTVFSAWTFAGHGILPVVASDFLETSELVEWQLKLAVYVCLLCCFLGISLLVCLCYAAVRTLVMEEHIPRYMLHSSPWV